MQTHTNAYSVPDGQIDPWGTQWVLLDTGWASGPPAALEGGLQPLPPPDAHCEVEGLLCVAE